jgi:cyanophycinase-like exopeptidase
VVDDIVSDASGPGPLALVGSGEYLPHMAEIEGDLLAGRPPRYVQLATAAVPDGPEVVEKWHRLGRQQAERLEVEPVILPVADRRDADDPRVAAQVAGAGLIYLSGGNPTFLADTLRGTALWAAIVEAWRAGAALAGCSAGAMALTAWVPSLRHPRGGGVDGLALLPHLRVIPHFDAFASRMPDLLTRFLAPHDADVMLIGVDEDTALVGGPEEWTVRGRSSAWHLTREGRRELPTGTSVTTPV